VACINVFLFYGKTWKVNQIINFIKSNIELVVIATCLLIMCLIGLLHIFPGNQQNQRFPVPYRSLADETMLEQKLVYDNLPEQVKKQANTYLKNEASFIALKEVENGVFYYEVEGKTGDFDQSLKTTKNGIAVEFEQQIPVQELPAEILAVFNQALPGGKLVTSEIVCRFSYEIKAEINGEKHELEILPTGRVMSNKQGD